MSKKIGMMDPAYFVPKTEIIKWVNEFLEMHINKIEDTCSGIFDIIIVNNRSYCLPNHGCTLSWYK